jgi:transposase-like protein
VSAQRLVVQMVQRYKMSMEAAAQFGREVLHLAMLDATTVLDWLREAGSLVDVQGRRRAAAAAFSGQMAVDEVYDGPWYQLKATDPLNDVELAWHVGEGAPTKDDIRRFFKELKAAGFSPTLVVTDGSDLYPEVIKEVWPEAEHQRCVFHFIKQINQDLGEAFWKLYETMPKPPKRLRGRPKKRGRPREDKGKRENRMTVRAARFLVLMRERRPDERRNRFGDAERTALNQAIALCPPLGVLRRFVVQLHELFGPTTDSHELAEKRRRAILDDEQFKGTPSLSKAVERLRNNDLFARLTRYLDFQNAEKTSNHVERENREFRKRQKGHYRFRSRCSLCALLDLLAARHPIPLEPVRLARKTSGTSAEEEVRRAA